MDDDEMSESESGDADQRLDELESRLDEMENSGTPTWNDAATSGYGLGSLVAAILSWDLNHAVGWLIIHSLLSWIYVIYRIIVDWHRLKIF